MDSLFFPLTFVFFIPILIYFICRWVAVYDFGGRLSVVLGACLFSLLLANYFLLNESEVRCFAFYFGAFFWCIGGLWLWIAISIILFLMFIFRCKDGKTFVGGVSEWYITDSPFMSIGITFPFGRLIFPKKF